MDKEAGVWDLSVLFSTDHPVFKREPRSSAGPYLLLSADVSSQGHGEVLVR
jgi:hypothetical protein